MSTNPLSDSADSQKQWSEELAKVGLTDDLFEAILNAAPDRETALGYPQDLVDELAIYQNW
jgi:hypothetical protein